MKRICMRLMSILTISLMLVTLLPADAYAWKNLTHVNSADLILLELQRSAKQNDGKAKVTVHSPYDDKSKGYSYEIPKEFQDALFAYPAAFRAGSMGPDFYPDMLTGQGYIHPYDSAKKMGSGEWIPVLCNSVNRLPKDSKERKEALAFTLGFMLHYCGDMFGHDFINQFSGGTYPDLALALDEAGKGNTKGKNLNIIFSHMATETYMDSKLSWDLYSKNDLEYLSIAAPMKFVANTLVYDGHVNNGHAKIFNKYGSVPAQYTYLIQVRQRMYALANESRESTEVFTSAVVKYLDAWIEDLDAATFALVESFDRMASRMVMTEPSKVSTMTIVREELNTWAKDYGSYITPAPDILVDGVKIPTEIVQEIADKLGLTFITDIQAWIEGLAMDIVLSATGLDSMVEMIEGATDRVEDPSVQLDHKDNPFKPAENNFAEFDEYMKRYADEQKLLRESQSSLRDYSNGNSPEVLDKAIDSDLEAFYNTMVMFKLIIMGPDNFEDFIGKLMGEREYSDKEPKDYYHNNTARLAATSLLLSIKTSNVQGAGTDDNIFAEIYDARTNKLVKRKLLDISNHNDFERNQTDYYRVELGTPVPCDQMVIKILQETPKGLGAGLGTAWDCDDINVMPVHAETPLHSGISVGGRSMDTGSVWNLNYQAEVQSRMQPSNNWPVTRFDLEIKTKKNQGATNYGTDANVYVDVYDGNTKKLAHKLDEHGNDFNNGDHDTYRVYLSNPIQANRLNLKFYITGLDDDWTPEFIKLTPYHREIQLANQTTILGETKIVKGKTYDCEVQKKISFREITPLKDFSYDTALDDGLAIYVDSLDDSRQWINNNSLLWNDKAVREEVFFKIFKGFGPEVEYSGTENVAEGELIDNMKITFKGMWNGVRKARREAVANSAPMPAVKGSARIAFINEDGVEVCHIKRAVKGEPLSINDYTNRNLKKGVYDVKVTYTADSADPQYSSTEKVFEKALTITEPKNIATLISHPQDLTLTYGDTTDNILTVEAEAKDDQTISYQWYIMDAKDDENGVPIPNATEPSCTVPTDENVGTTKYYYCIVTTTDSEGSKARVASDTAAATINKASLTVTAKDQGYVYNGQMQGPGGETYDDPADIARYARAHGLIGEDSLSSITIDGQGQDKGDYTLTASDARISDPDGKDVSENYEINYIDGNMLIADQTKTIIMVNGSSSRTTYNATEQSYTGEVTASCDDASVDLSKFSYDGPLTVNGKNAGEYTLELDKDNCVYDDMWYDVEWIIGDPVILTVDKAEIIIQAHDKTSKIGDGLKDLTHTVIGDYFHGDDLGIKLTANVAKHKAGTYAININWNDHDNYEATLLHGKYTVTGTHPILLPKAKAKGKTSLNISWNRINGVSGYDIFFSECNHGKKNNPCKLVKTINGNKNFSWTRTGLKKKADYKAYVKAFVYKDGQKTYVKASPQIHAFTGNGTKNYTNAKAVKVNKTKVSLKKGKTFKVKAKVVKVKKSKKLMSKLHAPKVRYMTTDSKVATVNGSGKITAIGKGTCTIVAFAHNGVSKSIKVTVK